MELIRFKRNIKNLYNGIYSAQFFFIMKKYNIGNFFQVLLFYSSRQVVFNINEEAD
jgi:hypothetical protein